jgi:hypothetical protein
MEEGGRLHDANMEGHGVPPSNQGNIPMYVDRRSNSGHVLGGLDKTLRTIVLILYKKEVNQYPNMAFFGGVFSKGKVSV